MTLRAPESLRLLVQDTALDSTANSIRIGTPVLGHGQWYQMAEAINWLMAHGGTLVSGNCGVTAFGVSPVTWRWYNFSSGKESGFLADQQARIWIVQMVSDTFSGGTVTLTESGTTYTWATKLQATNTLSDQIFIFPEIANSTPGEDIGITIEDTLNDNTIVVGISCHEVPLHVLQENDGVHESTCRKGIPILDQGITLLSGNDKSVKGTYEGLLKSSAVGAKRCMFSWCNPTGITITSSTLTNLFRINPAMSARHLGSSTADEQRSVIIAAYAVVSGTSPTGEVTFTPSNGSGAVTLSVPDTAGAYAWYVDPDSMYVDTDDPTRYDTDGGIRGGTRDTIAIEARKTAGTSITIKSISIGYG